MSSLGSHLHHGRIQKKIPEAVMATGMKCVIVKKFKKNSFIIRLYLYASYHPVTILLSTQQLIFAHY